MKASGQPSKQILDRIVKNPNWDRLPDGVRRLVMKKVVETNRRGATQQMLARYPDLLQAKVADRIKRKTGER